MTEIRTDDTPKQKVHTLVIVLAELLVAVGLGCALWFGLGDRLTFTIRTSEPIPAAAITPDAQKHTPAYSVSDIPEPLQELFLANPDAWQFVLHYPAHHDLHPVIDLSDLADTDAVPRLYQWDERWGYESYNENFFARSGCGPTCLSMVDIYLTGNTAHNPLWMARYAEANGYNEVGNGSKWTLFSEGCAGLGLRATGITLTYEYVAQTLASGTPIICAMAPGDFTVHGHYLVLTGIDENGNIILNDPNSRRNSMRTWTFEQLAPQIRGGWAITKDNVE